jgi:hypothetical protein
MKPLRLFFWTCMSTFAVVAHAQAVINSGTFGEGDPGRSTTTLPLRNLQIEVRQVEQDNVSRERLDASAAARLQAGQSSAVINIDAQGRQSSRSGTAQQQVLVLNGRRAAIVLGQAVPLRLLRTVWLNGVWRTVPGTLWLQAGTGFDALPRWDGSNMVELELSASQSRGSATGVGMDNSSTSSTLMLPLGEWMTIAQSDQDQDSQQSGLGSLGRASSQTRLEVQVRVNVR